MGRLLPTGLGSEPTTEPEPRVIGIEGEDADELLAAMSSETARELLGVLHDEPAAASELADRVDTSLQNVQYHLKKLADAGVVEVVDTVYSEKGREMKLYAPANRPLVVIAGGESETADLRTALTTLLTGLGVVALLGVLVQTLADEPEAGTGGGDGSVMMTAQAEATPVAGAGGPDLAGALAVFTEPGILFFLGGLVAVLVGLAVWRIHA